MDSLVRGFSATFLDQNLRTTDNHRVSPSSNEGNSTEPTINLINQMLMEEDDLENIPYMFHESLALQATEKSFYDALADRYPSSSNQILYNPNRDFFSNCSSVSRNTLNSAHNFVDHEKHERDFYANYRFESISPLNGYFGDGSVDSFQNISKGVAEAEKNRRGNSPNGSRAKKTRYREEGGEYENDGRSNKKLDGSSAQESDEHLEMYDKVLLLPELNPHLHQDCSSPCLQDCSSPCLYDNDDRNQNEKGGKLEQNGSEKGSSGGGRRGRGGGGRRGVRGRKNGNKKEMVDFRDLLFQCAGDISRANTKSAKELLNQIRQHSSPHGDGTQRLAYYFANALEVRLAGGTGTALSADFTSRRRSAADILRSFKTYVKACPFHNIYHRYANRSIGKVARKPRLHIIDFGISYGFQWPCLIQGLSLRPNGPPKVRITGIDFPRPGFRPAERVEATGQRLATYCKRFGVPFEFNAIAKQWDQIVVKDLNIERGEVLVVNCLHRLRNVPDDIVGATSPRDTVLNLIRRINPDLFVHGIQEGTYDTPFFVTRFREAFLYYSARFDIFDATLNCEDKDRVLFEKEVFGWEIMNVVACEGSERVERPETHKQWLFRNTRAGFSQLPLNEEILRDIKAMVLCYNKNFGVDEDGKWMVQLWKGRVMYALSCWKPNKEQRICKS